MHFWEIAFSDIRSVILSLLLFLLIFPRLSNMWQVCCRIGYQWCAVLIQYRACFLQSDNRPINEILTHLCTSNFNFKLFFTMFLLCFPSVSCAQSFFTLSLFFMMLTGSLASKAIYRRRVSCTFSCLISRSILEKKRVIMTMLLAMTTTLLMILFRGSARSAAQQVCTYVSEQCASWKAVWITTWGII